jgi:hypothetical protein
VLLDIARARSIAVSCVVTNTEGDLIEDSSSASRML